MGPSIMIFVTLSTFWIVLESSNATLWTWLTNVLNSYWTLWKDTEYSEELLNVCGWFDWFSELEKHSELPSAAKISWSFLACAAVGIERKAFFALSFDGLHHVIGVLRALVIIITERECFKISLADGFLIAVEFQSIACHFRDISVPFALHRDWNGDCNRCLDAVMEIFTIVSLNIDALHLVIVKELRPWAPQFDRTPDALTLEVAVAPNHNFWRFFLILFA